MQHQPKKKRTVVRGIKKVSVRPVYREPLDLDTVAECLLDVAHRAVDSDIERWAKFGEDTMRDLYGPNWRDQYDAYMQDLAA